MEGVHAAQRGEDVVGGVGLAQAVLKHAVEEKGQEADGEEAFDSAVGAVVDGSCAHLCLHDAERLLDFPAGSVDFQQVLDCVALAAVAAGVLLQEI